MTILFLCPAFYPQIGGVEKHAFEVAKRLSKKHKVIIVTEGDKDTHQNVKGLDVYRIYFGGRGWFKKFRIWKKIIAKKKLFQKADIVHCHDVFIWYLPLRFVLPGKKVYTTFHGYETSYPPGFKAIFIRRLSEKLSLGNICIGEYIKKWYGTKPDFVLYGAVNNSKAGRKRNLNRKSKLKILFLGRLEKDTGVKIYSEALNKIKNFELKVCGDGSLRKEFEKYTKVMGFVENVDKFIINSDIIFASSYLSILSSLNKKRPVFSVYQNHLKHDYLTMTPFAKWISLSASSLDLEKKINQFRDSPKSFQERAENGYNWVSRESWDKIASFYCKLYKI